MKPISYTQYKNKIVFKYPFTELRKFVEQGRKEGNVGLILVGYKDNFNVYKGYGTIENPCTELRTVYFAHNVLFDGRRRTPEEVIKS